MSLPRKADVASFPREAQPDVGGLPSSAADRWRWWWLVAFAAVVSAMLARSTLTASFGHDEIEHAHVTWQLTQGLDPYVAFHQNHTPMLWLMAAPILEIMPVDVRAMIALRCLSLVSILVIAIMAVKVTRRLHGGHARLAELELWVVIATALLASALGANRFRPDAPMAACVAIAGGLLVLHQRPRWPIAMTAGLALGVAAALTLKVWPMGLAVLVVAWLALRRHGWRDALRLVLAIGLGFVVPLLAVAAWMASRDLVAPFIEDVLAFNAGYKASLSRVAHTLDFGPMYLTFVGLVVSFARLDPALMGARAFFVCGLAAPLLGAHASRYMLLAAMFGAVLMLGELVRWTLDRPTLEWRRWSLHASLMRFGVFALAMTLVVGTLTRNLAMEGTAQRGMTPATLDAMIGLVREHDGARCFALAPVHPVFCHDAVPIAIGWDLLFLGHPTPRFRERQERLWEAGLKALREAPPELVFIDYNEPVTRSRRLDAQARAGLAELWRTRYDELAMSADVGAFVRKN